MNNNEIHRDRARKRAEADIYYGLKCSPQEWGAAKGSAWESWHLERYKELKEDRKT